MWIIGFSGNQPLLNRFGYFRIDHEAWYFCTAVTCSGERCFSNWLYFSLSHTAPSVFPFCFQVLCLNVWMLFTFSTSFASPCLLSHLGSSRTPFYAVDFLLYCCLFFFFFVLPSPACVWALCSRPFRLLRDGGWQGVKKEEDRYMPGSMEGKKTLPPCRSILCGLLLLLIPFSFHLEVNVLPMGDLHICCFS